MLKKIIYIFVIIAFCVNILWLYSKNNGTFFYSYQKVNAASEQSIAEKIIRFHVLANSDSIEDQALKLKVKDKVLEYMQPKLSQCKNIDESRKVLKINDKNIVQIARKVIEENGYKYNVKTELQKTEFPVKKYGTIVLPEGEYEAYRILIGSAKGQNWWCVMFPPLCFTDITKGQVEVKKTQAEMKTALTKEEYSLVDNSKNEQQNKKIVIKFKLVEEAKEIISEIQKNFTTAIKHE